MKTLVAALITALVVFTLSTVWSEVVQPGRGETAAISAKRVTAGSGKVSDLSDSLAIDGAPKATSKTVGGANSSTDSASRNSLEQIDKAPSPSLLEQIKYEEAKIAEHQDSIELIYRDIFREIEVVKEIRRRSSIELAAAEKRASETASIQASVAAVSAKKTTSRIAQTTKASGDSERKLAGLVQGLVDRGNNRAAAALLAGMKEREASKILSLLKDPQIAAHLADQMQTIATQPFDRY